MFVVKDKLISHQIQMRSVVWNLCTFEMFWATGNLKWNEFEGQNASCLEAKLSQCAIGDLGH